jgi:hypothetical protein
MRECECAALSLTLFSRQGPKQVPVGALADEGASTWLHDGREGWPFGALGAGVTTCRRRRGNQYYDLVGGHKALDQRTGGNGAAAGRSRG